MKNRYVVYLLMSFILVSFACKPKQNPNTMNTAGGTEVKPVNSSTKVENLPDTSMFAVKAASGGMMEVQLGQLALSKASAKAVKDFGQQMVTDHSKANDQLKQIAASEKIDLPKTMLSKNQSKVDSLSGLSGKDFDKAYMTTMVKDHKEDIEEFQKASKDKSTNAKVKEWASKTLPTLKHHLSMAESALKKVK